MTPGLSEWFSVSLSINRSILYMILCVLWSIVLNFSHVIFICIEEYKYIQASSHKVALQLVCYAIYTKYIVCVNLKCYMSEINCDVQIEIWLSVESFKFRITSVVVLRLFLQCRLVKKVIGIL